MFINGYNAPPLEALTYLTGECNYGGRVTDDRDRRLITSLLAIFYNEQLVMEENHRLSQSGQYFVPSYGPYEDYVNYIRSLPMIPLPEVSYTTTYIATKCTSYNGSISNVLKNYFIKNAYEKAKHFQIFIIKYKISILHNNELMTTLC